MRYLPLLLGVPLISACAVTQRPNVPTYRDPHAQALLNVEAKWILKVTKNLSRGQGDSDALSVKERGLPKHGPIPLPHLS